VKVAILPQDVVVPGSLASIACHVQAVAAAGCARIRAKAWPRRRNCGRYAARGGRRVGSRRGMSMITGKGNAPWLVPLSVTRRGRVRGMGIARGPSSVPSPGW
jgi:hypothetical protein